MSSAVPGFSGLWGSRLGSQISGNQKKKWRSNVCVVTFVTCVQFFFEVFTEQKPCEKCTWVLAQVLQETPPTPWGTVFGVDSALLGLSYELNEPNLRICVSLWVSKKKHLWTPSESPERDFSHLCSKNLKKLVPIPGMLASKYCCTHSVRIRIERVRVVKSLFFLY